LTRRLLFALLLLTTGTAAVAGFPVTEERTCPIGGERFSFTTTASYSTWGARPDGKPFGSWEFPLALPECPGNGLVVYDDFSETDLARLEPLIAQDDYQALRRSGATSYYRAYWLMRRMEAPPANALWMLVQASWQAEGNAQLRRRYLEELVEAAPLLGQPSDDAGLAMRARVINALRELGRFDEATSMLEATPVESVAPDSASVRSAADWRGHYRSLARLIARRDSSIEPIDMIPWRVGRERCEGEGATVLDAGQRAICADVAARMAARRSE
jgi:tetratricopeptide (TPR) repeat protein